MTALKADYKLSFREYTVDYYYNPGQTRELSLVQELHSKLLLVNSQAKSPLDHKLLRTHMTEEQLLSQYNSALVCILRRGDEILGFEFCPVLPFGRKSFLHAGLVMINRNKGANLLGLVSVGIVLVTRWKLGKSFITNISSTPSIIEAFSSFTSKSWPCPKQKLVHPPKRYKDVARTLVKDYVLRYFPSPENVEFDEKRFVLKSNSKDMGFKVNPRSLSRSSKFDYYNFCMVWLDYSEEEDMIQVAKIDNISALKALYFLALFKILELKLNIFEPRNIRESTDNDSTQPSNLARGA